MVWALERNGWVGTVIVIAICGYLGARGVNHLLEARLLSDDPTPVLVEPAAAPAPPESRRERQGRIAAAGDDFAERNLFCSDCGMVEQRPDEPVAGIRGVGVPMTELPLELVATNVSGDRRGSFASIVNRTNHHQGAYHEGQRIPGVGVVSSIRSTYVDFLGDESGRLERLSLLAQQVAAAPATEPAIPRPGVTRAAPAVEERYANAVRQVDGSTWEVERAILDEIRQNPAQVRGARVMPAQQDGKMVGFRLFGVRPDSPYRLIGLESGDVLVAINGHSLTSMDEALRAYSRLQDESNLRLEVERRGSRSTLTYRVVN